VGDQAECIDWWKMTEELSATVRRVASHVFRADDLDEALRVLSASGRDLGGGGDHDRILLAMLKDSHGSIDRLHRASHQAALDWRDLLVGVGFGDDVKAHVRWADRVCSGGADPGGSTGRG
jgi:hypothetical protein